jgi:hypothetical protein
MWELKQDIEKLVEQYLEDSNAIELSGNQLGLDDRAGHNILISEEERWIAVCGESAVRQIEYYGGFEYINDDAKTTIGEYTLYCDDSSRVEEALDYFLSGTAIAKVKVRRRTIWR